MKLDLNRKLALFAAILGFIAIFGGNPQHKTKTVVNLDDLKAQIIDNSNQISVMKLADNIIKQKADFRLIDLRDENSYNQYHIPLAENIQINDFNELDMPKNEKYILYSDSDILTGQAWALLKAQGYKAVYVIGGGINEWKNQILFPKLSANATPEQIKEFDKIIEISKFFGGKPQTGVTEETNNNIEMPKLQMPQQVTVQKKKKLKKEGC